MKQSQLLWVIAVLIALLLWIGVALVRVENERYALLIGLCKVGISVTDNTCLINIQTRTAWWWHLYHGLKK